MAETSTIHKNNFKNKTLDYLFEKDEIVGEGN